MRQYCDSGEVFITNHAMERFRERGIVVKDILSAVKTGEVIEDYPDSFPFPSCLVCGKASNGKIIHVCMCDDGEASKVITAYYPAIEYWNNDFKTRKEASE